MSCFDSTKTSLPEVIKKITDGKIQLPDLLDLVDRAMGKSIETLPENALPSEAELDSDDGED